VNCTFFHEFKGESMHRSLRCLMGRSRGMLWWSSLVGKEPQFMCIVRTSLSATLATSIVIMSSYRWNRQWWHAFGQFYCFNSDESDCLSAFVWVLQEKMLKNGHAWHFATYDKRPEFAKVRIRINIRKIWCSSIHGYAGREFLTCPVMDGAVAERGKSCKPRAFCVTEPWEAVGLEKRATEWRYSGLLMDPSIHVSN
jgi:hypothetical protein